MTRSISPWIVVLAGGDGRRLQGALVRGRQVDRPKQFCRFSGAESLLEQTLDRAERVTDLSRIVVVVREDQRCWWSSQLDRLPSENVLVQTDNRGTGVAILHALVQVLRRDAHPTFVILPSDHAVTAETVLLGAIGLAARMAERNRKHLVLLGAAPEHPETEYGWILPSGDITAGMRRVERFVEKPEPRLAAELLAVGALWNTFVCASSGEALLKLYEERQPSTLRGYLDLVAAQGADRPAGRAQFRALPNVDFSRDVIQSAADHLRVLTLPPCGWTDLGTSSRVNQWLAQLYMRSPVAALGKGEALDPPRLMAADTATQS